MYMARVLVELLYKGPLKRFFKKDQEIEILQQFHTDSYIYPQMLVFPGETLHAPWPHCCRGYVCHETNFN